MPVNLEYFIGYDSVKEDIVLDTYQKVDKITFQLKLANVTYKEEEDGTIGFYDKNGKKQWFINRPYMTDSKEGYSDTVNMEVRKEGNNLYLDLKPDDEWLKDPDRAYPCRIDPTITLQPDNTESQDTYVSFNNPNTNYNNNTFLSCGNDSTLGKTRAFLWFHLPALPSGSWISGGTLSLYQYATLSSSATIQAYRVNSDWASSSLTWNSQPSIGSTPESSVTQSNIGWYNFNLYQLVQDWYTGNVNNFGVSLRLSDEATERRLFYSSDYSTNTSLRPKITINYVVNPLGTEDFWTYAGNVHTANGNLMLSFSDVYVPGRGIQTTITRTYNSCSSNSGIFGYGWNSELDVKITVKNKGPIQYIDADRTVHYFEQLSDGTYQSPPGLYLTLVKNGNGTYTITEKNGLKYNFSSVGDLTSITDAQDNTLTYTYTSGKITGITDPSGRTTTISYGTNNKVSQVIDYASRKTTYAYSSAGDLIQVNQAVGTSDAVTTYFKYDSVHNLIEATDPRGNKTYYYYTDDDRVLSINPINKVPNSNFEVDSGGDHIPDLWSLTTGQSGTYVEDSQTPLGYRNFKLTANNSYSVYQSIAIPVDRTKAYTLSGYVKATQTSGTHSTVLSILAYNNSNQNLGEFVRITKTGTLSWQRESILLAANTLPTDTAYITVKVGTSNTTGSGTSWFDGVQLEEGSTAGEFVGPTMYTVDRANMYSAVYDANGKKTKYRYNENGNVLEERVDPDGLNYLTSYSWDDQNNLTSMKDANANASGGGNSITNNYDSNGNGIQTIQNDGTASQITNTATYNSNNDLTSSKDGNANDPNSKAYGTTTEENHYDSERNNVSSQDALSTSTASTYNQGNITSETNPMGLSDNLIINSSFERDNDQNNYPDHWQAPTINGTATVQWGTTAKTGQRGMSISNVSNYVVIGNLIKPSIGDQDYYTFSGYFKATTLDAANHAYLKIDAYDTNNTLIGQVTSNKVGEINQWNKLQVVVWKESLPAGTVSIQPCIVVSASTGTVHFDDIQLENTPFTTTYNMLDNSSFDRGTTLPEFWKNKTSTLFTYESAEKFSGSKSIKITNPSGLAGFTTDYYLPFDRNKSYSFSGFVKTTGISNPAGVYLKLRFYNSSFQELTSSVESNKVSDGNTDWTRLEAHVLANQGPVGAVYVKPEIVANSFTGTAYFDSMRFQEGSLTTTYEYNGADVNGKGANNYITKVTDPMGYYSTQQYDSVGNRTSVTDAKGYTTSFLYDAFNRLKSLSVPGVDLKVAYTYDKNGNRTQVSRKNKAESVTYSTTQYQYNRINLLSNIIDPLNRNTVFKYDSAGNQTGIEYPNGQKVGFVYNKANRLEKVTYNGAVKYTFGYDPNGNRTSETDNSVNKTWTYIFDPMNRLTKVTSFNGSKQENGYDKNSNLTSKKVTVGANSYNTAYVYSITDKNIEVVDHNQNKTRFVYDEKDNPVQMISGNGSTANWAYDENNRVSRMVNTKASGDVRNSFGYTYDANGNITSVTTGGGTISYQYDALNQLTRETLLDGTIIDYQYSPVGNRTKKIVTQNGTSTTTNYTYDGADQLTNVNGQAYSYDANGNLLDNGNKKFIWDSEGRLTEVRKKSDNSLIAQYEYDSQGRRVKSTVNSIVTNYHYDGDSIQVLYETDGSGALKTLYTYSAEGLLLSMTKVGQGTYYYHYNAHGDVIQLTDQAGNSVADYTYDAWGNILTKTGTMATANLYRYAGYRYDEETGLYYLMTRYYDSNSGRFISKDTFHGFEDDSQSLNQYVYCANNPVIMVDPDGHSYQRIMFAIKYGIRYWLSQYVGWAYAGAIMEKFYALGGATIAGNIAYQLKYTSLTSSVTKISRVLKYQTIKNARTIAMKAALKVGLKVFFPASVINDLWHLAYGTWLGWKKY